MPIGMFIHSAFKLADRDSMNAAYESELPMCKHDLTPDGTRNTNRLEVRFNYTAETYNNPQALWTFVYVGALEGHKCMRLMNIHRAQELLV
jgi:hypothetical protein